MSELQTRVSRFNRRWVCQVCGWRAYVSLRKHFQTGQPLSRTEQIATLTYQASKHFREYHKTAFVQKRGAVVLKEKGQHE